MTGWRVGYALASREWTRAMLKVQGHSTSNPNSIAQSAAVEALNGPQESVSHNAGGIHGAARWLLEALQRYSRDFLQRTGGSVLCFSECQGLAWTEW